MQSRVWKGSSIQSSPPAIVTSSTRTIRCIRSKVSESASGTNCLLEHRPGSTVVCPSLCKAELQKILDTIDVRDFHLEALQVLNHPRGATGHTMPSWPMKMTKARGSPQTRHFPPSWCVVFSSLYITPAHLPLDADYVGVFRWQITEWQHADDVLTDNPMDISYKCPRNHAATLVNKPCKD